MTVIPFAARAARPEAGTPPPLAIVAAVTGTFCSPTGRGGTFTGSYRLERFVWQFGLLAAAGVFTGALTDADSSHIGTGSRRQTAAVEVVASGTAPVVRLGPLDVNLLGFLVTVNEMSMDVHGASRQRVGGEALVGLVDTHIGTDELPASAWLGSHVRPGSGDGHAAERTALAGEYDLAGSALEEQHPRPTAGHVERMRDQQIRRFAGLGRTMPRPSDYRAGAAYRLPSRLPHP